MSEKRRQFDRVFKLSAIRLLERSDQPLAQIARKLGICDSMLRRWRQQVRECGAESFDKSGRQQQMEVTRLRRENRRLQRELEMLKKTLPYLERHGK